MATKIKEPKINPALLKIMQGVYAEYTGEQISDVIAYIRASIEREQEIEFVRQEILRLTEKLETLSK